MPVTGIIFSLPFKLLFASATSLAISAGGYRKKSLNFSGAVAAVVVGFALTLANYCFFSSLLTFFLSSTYWTKWKSERKRMIEMEFREGGQRTWLQVFSNSGLPLVASIVYISEVGFREKPIDFARDFIQSALGIIVLGSVACCNGDTWSSEIGTAIGAKTPRLITTLKKVPIGTNGAISIEGTAGSILGGLLIGIVYYLTIKALILAGCFDGPYPPQWPIVLLGCFAGFVGSMLDSLLGATLQYSGFCQKRKKVVHRPSASIKHISGRNILDNNTVNVVSSTITGILTSYVGYIFWKYVGDFSSQ